MGAGTKKQQHVLVAFHNRYWFVTDGARTVWPISERCMIYYNRRSTYASAVLLLERKLYKTISTRVPVRTNGAWGCGQTARAVSRTPVKTHPTELSARKTTGVAYTRLQRFHEFCSKRAIQRRSVVSQKNPSGP